MKRKVLFLLMGFALAISLALTGSLVFAEGETYPDMAGIYAIRPRMTMLTMDGARLTSENATVRCTTGNLTITSSIDAALTGTLELTNLADIGSEITLAGFVGDTSNRRKKFVLYSTPGELEPFAVTLSGFVNLDKSGNVTKLTGVAINGVNTDTTPYYLYGRFNTGTPTAYVPD